MLSTTSTRLTRFLSLLAAAVMLTLAGAGPVSATSITTTGLTVHSGDLTFNDFTCDFEGSGMMTGSCASISVTPLKPEPAGIVLSTNMSATGKNGSADAVVTFDMSALQGVNTVGLSFNSTFLGLGVDSVTELVYASLGGPLLGDASVICSSTGCAATTSVNIYLYGTYTSLYITKDIAVSSYVPNSSGSISSITQTFTEVPEPRSIALVGAILVGVFLVRGTKRRFVS